MPYCSHDGTREAERAERITAWYSYEEDSRGAIDGVVAPS